MKKIIQKTEEEMKETELLLEIPVNKLDCYFFACDKCNVAFFDKDIVIKSSLGGFKCPLIIGEGLFKKKKRCHKKMYGGNEECFNKYYKLNE